MTQSVMSQFEQILTDVCYMGNEQAVTYILQPIDLVPSFYRGRSHPFAEFIFNVPGFYSFQNFTVGGNFENGIYTAFGTVFTWKTVRWQLGQGISNSIIFTADVCDS